MKLKDLAPVLWSYTGHIQTAIVYDRENGMDIEDGCSVEHAIATYGEREVYHVGAIDNELVLTI